MFAKSLLFSLLSALPLAVFSQSLSGYEYQAKPANPDGTEWNNPQKIALNKEQPHAWFFTFANADEARKVLPEASSYWMSLNGDWQFRWVGNPEELSEKQPWETIAVPGCWNVQGIQKDGSLKWGQPIYSNQRVIFEHRVAVGDWKKGVMREPKKDWLTYKNRNEVGTYERTFNLPANWDGREIYLDFDGVDSFFYLYVNGKYVGFSKNSRSTAQFDVTPYLKKGENRVRLMVYRNSDGSFFESQDMFRLPGIIRTVALEAKPKVQVRDIVVIPDFTDNNCVDAVLNITANLRNLTKKAATGYSLSFKIYENDLYSAENHVFNATAESPAFTVNANGTQDVKVKMTLGALAKKWSAEAPWCYTLVGELKDAKGNVVETFSTMTGVRKCEIRETAAKDDEFGKAGRYYYLNNQPIKMKGVNRHENNPDRGHALTREQMKEEVMLMKRGNFNHVRNCHYPDDPYWYYLCNLYGIYLEDEANLESHQYYYGEASLSHVPELEAAHVSRNMEMVHQHVNHPSVCIWSLGNEAGPGKNFVTAYNTIKKFDTSRPVQYERNNDIVDMGSNQYPSVDGVRAIASGNKAYKFPFHLSEYAHSMGNACGGISDMWEAIESSNFCMGGAIWDWVDQAINNYTADGVKYWGYGGDFNDKPNDGMFCMNGVMRPDLSPKAQYFEVKKVYQNMGVKAVGDLAETHQIEVFNKHYFESLKDFDIVWSLWKDGEKVSADKSLTNVPIGARERQTFTLDGLENLDAESEYFVKVQFLLKKDMPWAKKGFVQAEEQLAVKGATVKDYGVKVKGYTEVIDGDVVTVRGDKFEAQFDKNTGALCGLVYDGQKVVRPGTALLLDAFRAPADNDNWAEGKWMNAGLYDLKHQASNFHMVKKDNGVVELAFIVKSQAETSFRDPYGNGDRKPEDVHKAVPTNSKPNFYFETNQVYTVYPDGTIVLSAAISSNDASQDLPRLGFALQTPVELDHYEYYGRGPVNNYNDRCSSQFIERHKSLVKDQGIILPKPQTMGNREDVRWCKLTDATGKGAIFVADSVMSASALPWTQQEMMGAAHPHQLPQSQGTTLHLDCKVTGLGGTSCGQAPPYPEQRAKAGSHHFAFAIAPAGGEIKNNKCQIKNAIAPISVERDRTGRYVFNGKAGMKMSYTLNGGKAKAYAKPFSTKDATTVKVWYDKEPKQVFTYSFEKIDQIMPQVIFANSVETCENAAAENLVDGNPDTFWHTMYSITMAEYPHWVDFDCAREIPMKGFVYLPRPGGGNGTVKDYEIYTSNDNKTWTLTHKGTFERGAAQKRVEFAKPVKARYIRFRCLSEQNGNSYASGAEFSVITD